MKSFEQMLEEYANLAVRVGINIQQGQTLVVNARFQQRSLYEKLLQGHMKQAQKMYM